MSFRRDPRSAKASLFDGYDHMEEGLRTSSSGEITDHDNDKAVESLQDRVMFLKRLTGDIHEEVEAHNRMLDKMGNGMDASRGIMSGTMDRFKKVFDKKSNLHICKLVAYLVILFFTTYYLIRFIAHFMWR